MADPSFSNVSLLLHCDGSNASTSFPDSSGFSVSVLAHGSAQVSTAQSRFGGGSLLLDGASWLSTGYEAGFDFGAEDFTVECWIRPTATPSTAAEIISTNKQSSPGNGWWIRLLPNFTVQAGISNTGTDLVYGVSVSTVTVNDWTHVAFVRSGSSLVCYINGAAGFTVAVSGIAFDPGIGIAIGRNNANSDWYFTGNIDDIRITKGEACYTGNFTPPSDPFPNGEIGPAELSGASVVGITPSAVGVIGVSAASSVTIGVSGSGAGAAAVVGQGVAQVVVTSLATAGTEYPAAEISGTTEVTVTTATGGGVAVSGGAATAVSVSSSTDGVVRSGAEIVGSADVDVSSAAAGAVLAQGQGAASVGIASTAAAQAQVTGSGTAAIAITSLADGVVVVGGTGDAVVGVVSANQAVVPIHGQAAATVAVSSKSSVRAGIRDFTSDVFVTSILREISARTVPSNVVVRTSPSQATVTTRRDEVFVLA